MYKFFAGFGLGIFAGYLLGHAIPIRIFLIACLVLMALVALLFFLFHLGIQDFQEY